MKNAQNLIGSRFGRLLVLSRTENWVSSTGKTNVPQWMCVCDCGNSKIVRSGKLKDNSTVSCGCYRLEVAERITTIPGSAGFKKLYSVYKKQANARGYEFSLSIEQFKLLSSQDCHYCGRVPMQLLIPQGRKKASKENGTYTYNGIDRKENDRGYIYENCLPCCGPCNRAKMNLSYYEFD